MSGVGKNCLAILRNGKGSVISGFDFLIANRRCGQFQSAQRSPTNKQYTGLSMRIVLVPLVL